MLNWLKYTTSLVMALLLLISTMQVNVYKMDCHISGNSKISLSEFENCNANKGDDCSLAESCCCFHQIALDFHFETLQSKVKSVSIAVGVEVITTAVEHPFTQKEVLLNFANLPPPSGLQLLKKIQVFQI